MKGKGAVILAVPSPYIREVSGKMRPFTEEGQIIVNVSKEWRKVLCIPFPRLLRRKSLRRKPWFLSGPSHAEEVVKGLPTTCVVSAHKKAVAEYLQNLFMSQCFQCAYLSPDILGVELGGALKNVIALAAGGGRRIRLGDNTKAALITRGIAEIARLGIAMSAQPSTFFGLTGHWRSDCDMCQCPQPEPGRIFDWPGIYHGRGHGRGENGGGRRLSRKSSQSPGGKYQVKCPLSSRSIKFFFEGKSAKRGGQ